MPYPSVWLIFSYLISSKYKNQSILFNNDIYHFGDKPNIVTVFQMMTGIDENLDCPKP